MAKLIVNLFLILYSLQTYGQLSLTLDDCQKQAQLNYPLIKKRALINRTEAYSVENAAKGYLPQFSINGQATYQSAVTEIPINIPGSELPQLKKDQYKVYGEVNQTLYDGGGIKQKIEEYQSKALVEEQQLTIELYHLKERVNQLFFGILMIEEQLTQNKLLIKDIQLGIDKIQPAIANGTALQSNLEVLQAELLKAQQQAIDLKANRSAYLAVLGLFLNRSLDEHMRLVKPDNRVSSLEIRRPELDLYGYQLANIAIQENALHVANRPKLDFFVQGGYGRPALNILKPRFEAYYIGGLRMRWNFGNLYTLRKDKAILDNTRLAIEVERETFLFNTQAQVKQEEASMSRYQNLLQSDGKIIALRERVKNTAVAQLAYGTITTSDYLREVNAADQARQNKTLHEIQLLAAQYNQLYVTGDLH